jgi:hypothetical protein
VAASGTAAEERYWEFFAGCLRNRNTPRAYLRAVEDSLVFLETRGVGTLAEIRHLHVAAHVEALTRSHALATAKQRLAAIRALLDWMTVGQAIPSNPAASVRGPRHVVRRGSTPVLACEDGRPAPAREPPHRYRCRTARPSAPGAHDLLLRPDRGGRGDAGG